MSLLRYFNNEICNDSGHKYMMIMYMLRYFSNEKVVILSLLSNFVNENTSL